MPQEYHLRLINAILPGAPFHLNPRPVYCARGSCRPDRLFAGRYGRRLRFQTKSMQQHIFPFVSELQNISALVRRRHAR